MKFCDTCRSTFPGDFAVCPKDQKPLREADELAIGMQLRGKYEILEKIGSGGMATVYSARHLHLKENLAIKVVGTHLMNDKSFLERFQTEAVITRRLQHPNAVRLDDFDITEDGRPFIVMEHVHGEALRHVIARHGHLPVRRALEIARQTALALDAAHKLGIVHRDIKPDNILIVKAADGGDVVKVLDFGIAKVLEGSFDGGSGYVPTKTGLVLGTPQYLSPEQAQGKRGGEVDGRSDLYTLGVMLYEMLTGSLPFHSDTPIGLLMHHIQTPLIAPSVSRPELGIPDEVSGVLLQAMAKDRTQRFQSGEEMAQTLARAAANCADEAADEKRPSTATFNTAAMLAAAAAATSSTLATPAPAASAAQPAAMAAAASAAAPSAPFRTEVAPAPQPSSTLPNPAAPPVHVMTKVMGSDVMEPVKPTAPKRTKFKYALIGAGAVLLAIVAWLAWPAPKAEAPPASESIPAVSNESESGNRRSSSSSRSGTNRRSAGDSQPRTSQSAPQTNSADKLRSQELTARGWHEISQKSYRNAEDDFQEALRLDPSSSSAQKGLQTAQAAQTMQGITGIFRR